MKRTKAKKTHEEKPANGMIRREPTLFARMMDINCELRDAMGLEPLPGWQPATATPEWVKNVCVRYRQTILKAVLKLKPQGEVNWRNYGRCVGLMERCKTFYQQDVPKILKEEGLHRFNKSQQAKYDEISGEEEMRQYFLKVLNQPLVDKISLPDLLTLVVTRQFEILDKHRQLAFYHIANQDAKTCKLFYTGMAEGYSIFLNEDGKFSGDDRRADVYGDLLAFQYEVEKMRRTLPAQTREDLRYNLGDWNETEYRKEWFNDICDEIKLSMKSPGAPHKINNSSLR
jgi:hypothetical protein